MPVVLLRDKYEKPKQIFQVTVPKRGILNMIPKDVERHMLLSGSCGWIWRFKGFVDIKAKVGMDFSLRVGKASPGRQHEPHAPV